ncbi:rhodanese-like domain-containing protein [Varunaivibrio sulfuroxidans]|uniref:Rhodanese-related sulfurtransferase n=1 Tax=Varunaivibrio sulfuroxidans TaxID=1773489 RepID=A0A4R3JBZ4_9PROT|nr:rhodanese-like domain-containing protein [Varunaivibrio sulfuroxidans]TCS62636.1 rhodanese-related sulfurtransferase [Varunaivibrio sulfuroxidans]WES30697.1 rhodanese-like domain-containing protein [Varunaivibrio sulfuroxidans]
MGIKDIDPYTVKDWLVQDKAILVDVREAHEHAREHIALAHHVPLSCFDPSRIPVAEGKSVVYYCASGARTAQFGHHLTRALGDFCDVYHLSGGIFAWKMAGFETEI